MNAYMHARTGGYGSKNGAEARNKTRRKRIRQP